MQNWIRFTVLVLCALVVSCDRNDDNSPRREYLVAVPMVMDLQTFRDEAVDIITDPVPMVQSGKIYAYGNYIFVNDVDRGFHIIDNRDPSSPSEIGYIKLEGNNDMSIKNNRLYADSYGDLVVFDISNMDDIRLIARMKDAIYQIYWCTVGFDVEWPAADFYDYATFDPTTEAIVGWEVTTQILSENEVKERFFNSLDGAEYYSSGRDNALSSAPTADTGQGGSMARFRIVGDYLYAVDWSSINIFDISDLDRPKILEEVYTSGTVETLFNQGNVLFLGGTQGMHIYDITNPEKPVFMSEFRHGKACDPVVVDGDYAYVTLRAGNACGDTESGLYIVDISDLKDPKLKVIYPMDDPYGLGIKGNRLFICDGASGLKVYDSSKIPDLPLLGHYQDIHTYDVIPLERSLLMIGDGILYQYEYTDENIRLLGSLSLK